MATRLKTVEYWFQTLDSIVDNTDTNFTQITVYLPETGTKTFRSVTLEVQLHNRNTTISNLNRRQISLQLAAAGYSAVNNTNAITQSGEQYNIQMSGDFTSYFTTNWSGTSMTCDARILCDDATSTPLNPSFHNATGLLTITYEYDDTSTTQVKTVRIPLDAPLGAVATSKPGSAVATIPALDTYCPEASKTFRQRTVVIQGNNSSASTTDFSMSTEVDTAGVKTAGTVEAGSNAAQWHRIVWHENAFTTSATHSWYLWGSSAKWNHMQAWLVVTYEFNASTSTTILNSLLLPMEVDGAMGGTAAGDVQRTKRSLWIEEPATITVQDAAIFVFWDQSAAMTGLNMQAYRDGVTPPGYSSYTDQAAALCGCNGAMFLVPTPSTNMALARGLNTLVHDIYNTDATNRGYNVSTFWLINYHSGKHTDGVGAHNHSVAWNIFTHGTGTANVSRLVSATAPIIPEASYFLNSIGMNYQYYTNSTGNAAGVAVGAEISSGTGWAIIYEGMGGTDPEIGTRQIWGTARSVFQRWPGDNADSDRLDLETARRWRATVGGSANSWDHMDLWFTYHTISAVQTRAITGSGGGTVNIAIHRTAGDERIATTSRSGNGNYTFTWYDDTATLYAVAREDATHVGRSENFTPSL